MFSVSVLHPSSFCTLNKQALWTGLNRLSLLLPPQTPIPPSAPRPPAVIALTGAAWPTGSSAHAWVASTRPTSHGSTSSTTYLRARASAWASCRPTPTTAAAKTRAARARRVSPDITATAAGAAACSKSAAKSAWASC